MNRLLTTAIFAAAMLLLLAACDAPTATPPPASGTVVGQVTVGPLCPVEPCTSTVNPYEGREVLFEVPDGTVHAPLNRDGSFTIQLRAGTYLARLDRCEWLGCNLAFPQQVTVVAGQTVTLRVAIDTGIR